MRCAYSTDVSSCLYCSAICYSSLSELRDIAKRLHFNLTYYDKLKFVCQLPLHVEKVYFLDREYRRLESGGFTRVK